MKHPHDYLVLGDARRKAAFTREHCRRLHQWFDRNGKFRHPGTQPTSRERLWNCCSLLEEGSPASLRLAHRIILATPIDGNHFLPITAAELALRFPEKLSAAARDHLVESVRQHYVNMFEWRFGTHGIHNFVCMTTFYLLAAPLLLERFEFPHRFASIPEVYSRDRMEEHGRNALKLLLHEWEERTFATEFNSPTYSPISTMACAKIVELIPDAEVRALALEAERRLWKETLAFYHPNLGLVCGPHSRAYRNDILGQLSDSRMLLAYVGLSTDRSLVGLFDETQPDLLFQHDGDVPFTWSVPAWIIATRYHVPTDALREMQHRRFPKRITGSYRFGPFGMIDTKKKRYLSVHGTAVPGGETDLIQVQHRNWTLGYRSYSVHGHSFPIHLHYAIADKVGSMRDARNAISGVLLQGKPEEWTKDQRGQPIETQNFNHIGHMRVRERPNGLVFHGQPLATLAELPVDECSVNTFIPTHFAPVSRVQLNGRTYSGTAIKLLTRTARLEVDDHGFRYRVEYRFARPTPVRLYRWARFLRFAGFFYEGEPRQLTPSFFARTKVAGQLTITPT